GKEADDDLPPPIVTNEAFQAQDQRGREKDVGRRDDEPHPPERLSEILPAGMLGRHCERDQNRGCDERKGGGVVTGLTCCCVQASRVGLCRGGRGGGGGPCRSVPRREEVRRRPCLK